MIDHRALINYSDWAIRTYFRPGEIEFVPLFTSISFDLTITSIFPPLLSGNTILTFQHDDNDLAISKVIRDGRSTIIKCTPSHLKAARDVFEQMQSLSNINCVIVGGESFETHICSWLAKCLNRRSKIFNEYGPTEATVGCMIYEAGRDSLERTAVPIGKPINNMRCYILDDSLKPVPPGANGELYVAGVGLSKGYLNNQKSTSNVFIADVVSKTGLMYKTGDRARFISEQTIEYLGRFDHQVKISGHRIELSEVERCLNSSGLIRESVVLVKKNKTGDNFIVSYYCAGKEVLSKILRNYLLERLPSYMVPASFIWLREIPLTPNGKVDHKRLNALTIEAHGNAQIEVDDPFQLKVLSVWADVLKEKDLSVTDNFFEFGGDSIKAVQIAARLFNQGIDIRAKEILKYQTVEEVSVRHQPSKNNTFVSDDVQRGEKGLIPIDCWFFSQQFQEIHYYNQSVVLQ
jgi:surfactin family lipopeptide synthetase A